MLLELVNSLTLTSGAVIVSAASAFLILAFGFILKRPLNWSMVFILPLALAYALYGTPTWLGSAHDQHWSWAPIFIGLWGVCGIFVSIFAALFVLSRKPKRK